MCADLSTVWLRISKILVIQYTSCGGYDSIYDDTLPHHNTCTNTVRVNRVNKLDTLNNRKKRLQALSVKITNRDD